MVTCRWWGNKFCKRSCKDAYLREVAFGRDKILCWYGFLRGGSQSSLPSHPNNQSRATITSNAATRQFGSNRDKADSQHAIALSS